MRVSPVEFLLCSLVLALSNVRTTAVAAAEPAFRLLGNGSCAAAGCHGGIKQANGFGGEYTDWMQHDRHARAYSVLLNADSKHMAALLKLPKPAQESAVCLNCHSPTTAAALAGPDDVGIASVGRLVPNRELPPFDGVGCEQCHGPGEQWVEAHVRPDWKTRSRESKRKLGFRETKDLLVRSRACAECHVGSPGRDVNHDLIAAGHPRLFFEMSAFHNNMPKHWRSELDFQGVPHPELAGVSVRSNDSGLGVSPEVRSAGEAKLWAVGQLATAEAAVSLLEQRVRLAVKNPAAPWPELAEWNCFACHHDLRDASWRQTRTDTARSVSKPLWNSWPLALIDVVPESTNPQSAREAREAIAKLRPLMNRPAPPNELVSQFAATASRRLHDWAEALNASDVRFDETKLRDLLVRLSGERAETRISESWDSATQMFLGFSALIQAEVHRTNPNGTAGPRHAELLKWLESMSQTLNFPEGLHSPRDFGEAPVEQRLRESLRQLHQSFRNR